MPGAQTTFSLRTMALSAFVAATLAVACSTSPGARSRTTTDLGRNEATATARTSWAGTDPAPEFPGGLTWFNVQQPFTMRSLRGKIVLLDFWTLGCINCQHIIPDLKRLEDEFPDSLVVIGVHSGKYSTEHDDESIREAIRRYRLHHAVVNDPDFAAWETFGAHAWPTLILIDPAGNLVGGHAGEGVYPLFQPILASLREEFQARQLLVANPVPLAQEATSASTVLSYPSKAVADVRRDRLYIADSGHNRVLVSTLDGRLERAIGSGKEGFADGEAYEAAFRQPQGLALTSDGATLYVADTRNHAIRAVDTTTGAVTTIAGTGRQLQQTPGAEAKGLTTALASPWDVLVHGRTLFVSMAGIHQIWSLDLDTNEIAVFAGTSREGIHDGNRKRFATLAQPSGLAADNRYLYWVDPESSSVRRVPFDGEGEVETLVGKGLFDFGDANGSFEDARLQHAQGVAISGNTLVIGDTYNHRIRAVDLEARRVTTLAGAAERGWKDGSGGQARFAEPTGVSIAAGIAYIADQDNHLIRTLDLATGRAGTLQLTNLSAIAGAPAPGSVTRVTLPVQTVSPGATQLRITFTTPTGYHLNSQAPSELALQTSNPAVVELGERSVRWSTDEGQVTVPVPVNLAEGSTAVTAVGYVYYCRSGQEALCFIQPLEITLPVTVARGAAAGEIALAYALPQSP